MGYVIELQSGGTSNHIISILGYKRATKLATGKTYNYLMVFDGWHDDTVRYINYTTVDFSRYCAASRFSFKK